MVLFTLTIVASFIIDTKHDYAEFCLQEWTDSNLMWNESEYENIKDLRIPPAYIWAPDILMYNR